MSLNDGMKIVEFDKYCHKCVYFKLKEHEEPCDSCLAEGENQYSHKPVKFLEDVNIGRFKKSGESSGR